MVFHDVSCRTYMNFMTKNNTEQSQRKITSKSQDAALFFEMHLKCTEYFILVSRFYRNFYFSLGIFPQSGHLH